MEAQPQILKRQIKDKDSYSNGQRKEGRFRTDFALLRKIKDSFRCLMILCPSGSELRLLAGSIPFTSLSFIVAALACFIRQE